MSEDNSAANTLTSAGLAALFAESWFPSATPGYGAAGVHTPPLVVQAAKSCSAIRQGIARLELYRAAQQHFEQRDLVCTVPHWLCSKFELQTPSSTFICSQLGMHTIPEVFTVQLAVLEVVQCGFVEQCCAACRTKSQARRCSRAAAHG